jgi:hypothetical protein
LFWSLWHKAIAKNTWREKINHNIQVDCSSYEHETIETIIHRFWQCLRTRTTQEQAFSSLYSLNSPINISSTWPLNLEQYIFNKKLPKKLKKLNVLWSLIRSVTL